MKQKSKRSVLDSHAFNNLTEEKMIKEKKNYQLGLMEFKTKSEITQYFKTMLNSYELKDIVYSEDAQKLMELLQHHSDPAAKIGVGVRDIKVDSMEYGTRCFHIIRVDGSMIDFSYTQCINNLKK